MVSRSPLSATLLLASRASLLTKPTLSRILVANTFSTTRSPAGAFSPSSRAAARRASQNEDERSVHKERHSSASLDLIMPPRASKDVALTSLSGSSTPNPRMSLSNTR
eukprot:CAMPEP_0114110898 /NCGR_PEP_ID=MMETSP0043_2-20121206/1557_1 /TAXON_ID=464988 /ORGANISM="Hemiselmis andersenii, Strain CCMP644" /LENGTH=107 /DNA_ID=CAMNT_0001202877 /DNA_START=756 /DNA_END=1079 /DNA_ORIENTATION=-